MHKFKIIQLDGFKKEFYLDDKKLEGVIGYSLDTDVVSYTASDFFDATLKPNSMTIKFAVGSDFEVLECGSVECDLFEKKEISRTDLIDLE